MIREKNFYTELNCRERKKKKDAKKETWKPLSFNEGKSKRSSWKVMEKMRESSISEHPGGRVLRKKERS